MDPRLAALVVHDLKNALGGLEARLHELARQHPDPLTQQTQADCHALRQRFTQFLTLYGLDERLRAHASDESPASLLQSVAQAMARQHPALQVSLDLADAPPFWYMDAHLLRLALDAALHNAARFARTRIWLRAWRDPEGLRLIVDDDGPGLQSALASSHEQDPLATGLGTALCRAVAQAHQLGTRCGRCSLSTRPDGGARFELCLP